MARRNTYIIAGIVVAVGVGLYAAYESSSLGRIAPEISALRFHRVQLTNSELHMDVRISNAGPSSLLVDRVYLNVSYQGSLLGTINISRPTTIRPFAKTTVTLPLSVSNLTLATHVSTILRAGKLDQVQLKGSIVLGGISFPVETTQDLPIPQSLITILQTLGLKR